MAFALVLYCLCSVRMHTLANQTIESSSIAGGDVRTDRLQPAAGRRCGILSRPAPY